MKRTPLSRGFLSDTINDDRYLLLARIRLLKRILGRIRPERSSPPLPRRSATGKSIGPTRVSAQDRNVTRRAK
jgi:hypothetical protein